MLPADLLAEHGAAERIDELVAAAWQATDPVILELCRLRIATLLGHERALATRTGPATECGISEAKIAELAAWPTSRVFSAKDRSCLAFAEQLTIDVTRVTPQLVRDVYEHFSESDGFGFIASVAVIEQELRLSLTLERLLG